MVKLTPCWAPNVAGEKMLVSFVPAGDQKTRPLGPKSNTLPQCHKSIQIGGTSVDKLALLHLLYQSSYRQV